MWGLTHSILGKLSPSLLHFHRLLFKHSQTFISGRIGIDCLTKKRETKPTAFTDIFNILHRQYTWCCVLLSWRWSTHDSPKSTYLVTISSDVIIFIPKLLRCAYVMILESYQLVNKIIKAAMIYKAKTKKVFPPKKERKPHMNQILLSLWAHTLTFTKGRNNWYLRKNPRDCDNRLIWDYLCKTV